MIKNNNYPVDIVITWVDNSDLEWQKVRNEYISSEDRHKKSTGGDERYQDDGMLNYIFRGIENFLPWVNKIHLVTYGHLPPWLNTQNPKLNIVNHKDFMPDEYLPTFAGNPLSLNFHRIPGLSEHFIYVNDDMYFISPMKPDYFFKKGLPRDMAALEVVDDYEYQDVYYYSVHNDLCLLNNIISKRASVKNNFFKYFNYRYGFKHNIKNLCLIPFNLFSGIYEPHTPAAYLKSTYEKVWSLIGDKLDDTSRRKVRSPYNCSENIFRYYQMASGNFYPINRDKFGVVCTMARKDLPELIKKQKYKMVCINYSDTNSISRVRDAFETILPNKSKFEL